jgi:hyperosmotically inducible periplasmic protein
MNPLRFIVLGGTVALCVIVTADVRGAEGTGEQVGKKVDQTIGELREGAKKVIEDVRASVERMGVEGRVYARLHWDKALQGASITVDVGKDGSTTLRGTVLDEKAKAKAEQLAGDTVGVQRVVNELKIQPTAQ